MTRNEATHEYISLDRGKLRYEYYTADIPSDAEEDPRRRFDLAVLQAQEHFTFYRVPAEWRKVWDNGEKVRVVRITRK